MWYNVVKIEIGGVEMNVGDLRKAIQGLPDEMELVGDAAYGQQDIWCIEVCTHQYRGLHYSESDIEDFLAEEPGFCSDNWEPLTNPTLKIGLL